MNLHNTVLPALGQALPTHSVPLLDFFFPGIGAVASTIEQAVEGKTQGWTSFLLVLGAFTLMVTFAYSYVERFVNKHYTSTILIPPNDEVRDMLATFVSTHGLSESRSTIVRTRTRGGFFADSSDLDNSEKTSLYYLPWDGQFSFVYDGRRFRYRSVKEQNSWSMQHIYLTCYGRSPRPIQTLLEKCHAEYVESTKRQTLLFNNRDGGWHRTATRGPISLDTVVLDETAKQKLVGDFERFLSHGSRKQYSRSGLPYRRGYLLHGPPGTGKTSITVALASHFGLNIYTLSLASVPSDESLIKYFETLPQRCCIILLEDVDAVDAVDVVATRRQTPAESPENTPKASSKNGVTLSALLNVIDGAAAVEHRILVMTTNHRQRLDSALIRPGRIDVDLELGLLMKPMIIAFLRKIYAQQIDGDGGEQTQYDIEVETIIQEVAGRMPESIYTPAELRSLCLEHLDSAQSLLDGLDEWMAKAGK